MCGIAVDLAVAPFPLNRMALASFNLEFYNQLYSQVYILILHFGLTINFVHTSI